MRLAALDPGCRRGRKDREKILAAAVDHFAGFIGVQELIANAKAVAHPIAELEGFCRTLGSNGTDALLLPGRA